MRIASVFILTVVAVAAICCDIGKASIVPARAAAASSYAQDSVNSQATAGSNGCDSVGCIRSSGGAQGSAYSQATAGGNGGYSVGCIRVADSVYGSDGADGPNGPDGSLGGKGGKGILGGKGGAGGAGGGGVFYGDFPSSLFK